MIEAEAVIKRWGNSFGIVLPKLLIRQNRLSLDDKVHVIITKVDRKNVAKRLWDALLKWKTSSDELEKLVDKEFRDMENVEFVK